MIDALVLGGTVTLIALVVLGIEFVLLLVLARRRAALVPLLANALSGVFLILALRAALLGSGATAIAFFLGLGFAAHMTDLVLRLRR